MIIKIKIIIIIIIIRIKIRIIRKRIIRIINHSLIPDGDMLEGRMATPLVWYLHSESTKTQIDQNKS